MYIRGALSQNLFLGPPNIRLVCAPLPPPACRTSGWLTLHGGLSNTVATLVSKTTQEPPGILPTTGFYLLSSPLPQLRYLDPRFRTYSRSYPLGVNILNVIISYTLH